MGDGDFNLCSPYKKEQITQEYGINMCNFFSKIFFSNNVSTSVYLQYLYLAKVQFVPSFFMC